MMKAKQQSRFLSSLLALAVLVSQSSFVFASFDMYPANHDMTDSKMSSHCMMEEMASEANSTLTTAAADCCETNDCANNYCVPGVHFSSSAIFNSVTVLHSTMLSPTIVATADRLTTGLEPSSLYRPPRLDA